MARALIVDDSKFMRRIIKDVLTQGGHEVIAEADNGTDAVEMYKLKKPDFVTMDITMGGSDGLEAVTEIKAVDIKAKVVVVSALSEQTLKLNDRNFVADAYLLEALQKEELLQKVTEMMK